MYSIKSVTNYSSSTSFQNSISSSNSTAIFSSSSATSYIRCEGLDLLAKAVQYVDGFVIGVPIVQKRVLIRRRRAAAYAFSDFVVNELFNSGGGGGSEAETDEVMIKPRISVRIPISKEKRQRRAMAVPLKYKDSLDQPWKRQTR